MAITVTEAAQERIGKISKGEEACLVFGVMGGGCSGFSYKFEFLNDSEKEDIEKLDKEVEKVWKIFTFSSCKIFVHVKSYLYVNGTEIDWVEELMGQRFVFNNPNVDSMCGCGESISFGKES